MNPKIDVITVGVTDLERARQFYEQGFGGAVREEQETLSIGLGANASRLALRPWDAVAADAGVPQRTTGFRGFSITHIVDSASRVEELLGRAARAGGSIVKAALPAGRGGYSGYFADPDGNLWRVASRG